MTAFIMGPDDVAALHELRELAGKHPIYAQEVKALLRTPDGLEKHMSRMATLTYRFKLGWAVTFSIEVHPRGTLRRMSVAGPTKAVPSPHVIMMIAPELGFQGSLTEIGPMWVETCDDGTPALNCIQPISAGEISTREGVGHA